MSSRASPHPFITAEGAQRRLLRAVWPSVGRRRSTMTTLASTTSSTRRAGSRGRDLTFFEFPGVPPGRAGDGMSPDHVLSAPGRSRLLGCSWGARALGAREGDGPLRGLRRAGAELAVVARGRALLAHSPESGRARLQGFDSVRGKREPGGAAATCRGGSGFEPGRRLGTRGERAARRTSTTSRPRSVAQGAARAPRRVASTTGPRALARARRRRGLHPTPVIDASGSGDLLRSRAASCSTRTYSPGFAADDSPEHSARRSSCRPLAASGRDRGAADPDRDPRQVPPTSVPTSRR